MSDLLTRAANLLRMFSTPRGLARKEGNLYMCLYCDAEYQKDADRKSLLAGTCEADCPVERARRWVVEYDEQEHKPSGP